MGKLYFYLNFFVNSTAFVKIMSILEIKQKLFPCAQTFVYPWQNEKIQFLFLSYMFCLEINFPKIICHLIYAKM